MGATLGKRCGCLCEERATAHFARREREPATTFQWLSAGETRTPAFGHDRGGERHPHQGGGHRCHLGGLRPCFPRQAHHPGRAYPLHRSPDAVAVHVARPAPAFHLPLG